MKISECLNFLGNLEIKYDGEFETFGLIDTKIGKKVISFIEDGKYIDKISSDISCLFIRKEMLDYFSFEGFGIIICDNPKYEFYKLHNKLCDSNFDYKRMIYSTIIDDDCIISDKSIISNNNVTIGKNVVIEENVIIRENVKIGDNSIIRAGSIIGGEGFLFNKANNKGIFPGKHAGGVIIGNNVEIQYNCCIDRAIFPWDNTIIDDFTKIDNLVHIGHSAKIGKRCLFPANSRIGGYTVIGDDNWIGLGATVSNNLVIGNETRVSIGSVVTKNVDDGKKVSGNFAIDHSKFLDFIRKIR
jgi:acetyltransferase-like isoleucine patch superfamily enzyme